MEQFVVFMQRREHLRRLFDHDHPCGAARGRFEAQRAAAGKEIEAVPAVEILAQPVEQRLANAVRCRAQAFAVGKPEDAPAEFTADDAYRVQSAATVTVISFSGTTRRAQAALIASAVTACTLAWYWSR